MKIAKVPVLIPTDREDIEILIASLNEYWSVSTKHRKRISTAIETLSEVLRNFDKVEAEMLEHSNRV
tara:strand:+ start:484 stop:684 length:201 start_codon:yes stop_codon:yes gene_type:complete